MESGKHRQWSERSESLPCTGGVFPGNDNGQGAVEPRWSCTGGGTEEEVSQLGLWVLPRSSTLKPPDPSRPGRNTVWSAKKVLELRPGWTGLGFDSQ